jgi:hypothetical protein
VGGGKPAGRPVADWKIRHLPAASRGQEEETGQSDEVLAAFREREPARSGRRRDVSLARSRPASARPFSAISIARVARSSVGRRTADQPRSQPP